MKSLATAVLVLGLIGAAVAQTPQPKPRSEHDLVQEFKGLAKPVPRAAAALQADYARAVKYLLDRAVDTHRSSHRREEAQADLEHVCLRAGRPGAEAHRAAVCKALVALLASEKLLARRAMALEMLGYVGRGESAEAAGALLRGSDKVLRERARSALQSNPSPAAAEQLHKALYQAVDVDWKVALINAVGYRRDTGSVDFLGKALKGKDEAVAMAAAAALGKIGGPEAIGALNDVRLLALPPLRAEIADALFGCAALAAAEGDKATATTIYRKAYENPTEPKQNRTAALRSLVAVEPGTALPVILRLMEGTDETILSVAMELAREIPGRAATNAFAALVPQATSGAKKVALIELLGVRGDSAGREAVLGALKGRKWQRETREAVRLAVIKALAGVGNENDVSLLVGLAGQTVKGKAEEQKWARFSLGQLRGGKVNEALTAALGEGDAAIRREAIRALGARGATEAVGDLLGLAGESDATLRRTALEALGQLADEKSLGALVKWMIGAKESYESLAAERAVINVCARCRDKAAAGKVLAAGMGAASAKTRRSLMRICGRLGGPEVLNVLAAGAQDDDENVREAAVSGMAYSPDVRASEMLLKIAKSAPKPDHRTLALKGYIRSMRQRSLPPEKKIWLYLQVLDLAQRPQEKKLALDGLGDLKTLGAMKFAMEHLYTPEVKDSAAHAVCRIARHLYETNPKDVRDAIQKVLQISQDENVVQEAKKILAQMDGATKKPAPRR